MRCFRFCGRLGLVALLAACGDGATQPDLSGKLVNLTGANTPLLEELRAHIDEVSGEALDTGDRDGLEAVLASAFAVAVDADDLTESGAQAAEILDVAQAVGTPIIWESLTAASLDDVLSISDEAAEHEVESGARKLAAAVGVGVEAPAAVVLTRPSPDCAASDGLNCTETSLIPIGASECDAIAGDASSEDVTVDLPETEAVATDALETASTETTIAPCEEMRTDARRLAEEILAVVRRRDDVTEELTAASGLETLSAEAEAVPPGIPYRSWTVPVRFRWQPDGEDQFPSVGVVYQLQLFASDNPNNKFLRITTFGAGFNPGSMAYDGKHGRGFWQDSMEIRMGPRGSLPSGFNLLDHSPPNRNNETRISSSTSLSVSVKGSNKGGEAGATYSSSRTLSWAVSDLRILNRTDFERGLWVAEVAQTGNQRSIGKWEDWLSMSGSGVRCDHSVHPPPELATATYQPRYQVVFEAPGNESRRLEFRLSATQRMRRVWWSNRRCEFVRIRGTRNEMNRAMSGWQDTWVDFSQVATGGE